MRPQCGLSAVSVVLRLVQFVSESLDGVGIATNSEKLVAAFDADWLYVMELRAFLSFRLAEISSAALTEGGDGSEDWFQAPETDDDVERLSHTVVGRTIAQLLPFQ